MTNLSEAVDEESPWWWSLISKRAALREQFPSLAKVRNERPGCAVDMERQRMFREEAQLRRAREDAARWNRACEENERRQERAENRARAREYRAYQERKAS